eukprot:m51a1_g9990 putative rubredoxin flavodoxin oxidoreductase (906) ;mRNA; f:39478-42836
MPASAVEIKKDLYWVGALDPNLRVFDIVMMTPFGTSYNCYLLRGTKATVLFETVKEQFYGEFEERLAGILKPGEKIDYFVLNHTEPDHSGALGALLDRFPDAQVVATGAAHSNLGRITHRDYHKIVVEQATKPIDIGGYTLSFIVAPFLHWPDTMFTYVKELRAVVTCDFLGSHYCLDSVVDDSMTEQQQKDYVVAAKGYYDPIFGPFKSYALKGLEYLSKIDYDVVCNSHGPVLRSSIPRIISLYEQWSQQPPLKERVVIAYVSAYRYTRVLAEAIEAAIRRAGVDVVSYDLVDKPVAEVMPDIEASKGLILGTPTILGDALPPIWQIATSLNPIIHKDHVVGVFGSYGWSGEGTRNIEQRLDQLRFRMPLDPLAVRFKPSPEDVAKAEKWAADYARALRGETLPDERKPGGASAARKVTARTMRSVPVNDGRLRRWRCIVCGEIVISVLPPDVCNACGAGAEAFVCLGFAGQAGSAAPQSSFAGHVVIIGGGCAAVAAAKAAREGSAKASITVVCGENEEPYYRPSLTRALADSSIRQEQTFRLVPKTWWADNNVKLLMGATATAVDTKARKVDVATAAGERTTLAYDALVLATGGKNFVPCPAEQTSATGVFNLRTLGDVDKIVSHINARKAAGATVTSVIVGGGLAALEAALALLALGVRCHIVELQPRLLPRQLTEEGSRAYTNAVTATGVVLHLGTCVKEITRDDSGACAGVTLANGQTVAADMVCFGVGTSPELALARAAGAEVRRAIVVDEKMRTNLDAVYAAGDCTEFEGRCVPTWTEAAAQGRVAGLQAVGAEKLDGATFRRVASPYYIDAFTPVFSIGAVPTDGSAQPVRRISFAAGGEFAELYFVAKEGEAPVLSGAQIIGHRAKQLQTPVALAIAASTSLSQAIEMVAPEFY